MAKSFETLTDFLAHGFDTVIDVRSPSEFTEDHVPGAVNLPVLSDAERAQVGTMYKQTAPFDARKLGAALVARNAADHIAGPLARHQGGWRPLIYCWRGGQRSGSFTGILQQIGWRAEVVDGGYRTWRRLVQHALYEAPCTQPLILIDGNTGTAKTALLARLAARGHQVIDLEGLANHRGSLLGARPGGQPAQKGFETALAAALAGADPARPLFVEAESSKVGDRVLPPGLWAAMRTAPRIEITAPLEARAVYAAGDYADLSADGPRLSAVLDNLRRLRGHDVVDGWQALLRSGGLTGLAAALMSAHYDPSYARSRAATPHEVLATLHAPRLDGAGIDALADGVEGVVRGT